MDYGDRDRSAKHTGLKLAAALGVLMLVLGGVAMAGAGKGEGRMFDRLDANSDDQVSPDEVQPFVEKRFKRFDANGDGVVGAAEIDAHLMKRMERRRQHLLKRFDSDGDGAITEAEFGTQVTAMFKRVDSDGNGTVSRTEAQEMRKHMRARWRNHMGHGMDDDAQDKPQEN